MIECSLQRDDRTPCFVVRILPRTSETIDRQNLSVGSFSALTGKLRCLPR